MRVFQDLTISGKPEDLQKLRRALLSSTNGWKPYEKNEDWTKRSSSSSQVRPFIAMDVPKLSRLRPATLFLLLKDEDQTAYVGNIVPDTGSLSPEEYNAILKSFMEECIQPYQERYRLKVFSSPEAILMEDTLSVQNQNLLRDFVEMANKSNGASHPHDYERWITFIGASVRDKERLRTDLLTMWLTEQGFPPYIASDLVQQYTFGFDLIKKLETDAPYKSGQETVHADR